MDEPAGAPGRHEAGDHGLQLILLVHTESRWVERWARDGERWIVTDHIGERGAVALDALGTGIDLVEVYEATEVG